MPDPLIIFLILAVAILLIWNIINTMLHRRLATFLQKITAGLSKKDLKTLLDRIDNKLDTQHAKLTTLEENLNTARLGMKTHLQNSALVRYNPFGDTGGNQSFALSLLDAEGNGFVVTSLHSREHTRVYAKEVRG
ncbi:MAG TPA: DUF4446 family protein, partial [Candidatus Saccharimonadia bacterium]|nr:DUF4446 family protein [Candidatus Saccharimonadia bacterium]